MKVYELAKELDIKALDLIEKIKPLSLNLKNHMADVSDGDVDKIKDFLNEKSQKAATSKKTVVRRKKKPAVRKKQAVVITRSRRADPETTTPAEDVSKELAAEAASVEESVAPVVEAPTLEPAVEVAAAATAPVEEKEEVLSEKPVLPEKPVEVENQRYSVIRVASRESLKREPRRPLIVEEASEEETTSGSKEQMAASSKRTADAILKEIQREESQKKRSSLVPKVTDQQFRSTDYLRRERIYQIRKKRLNLSRGSSKVSTVEMSSKNKYVEFDTRMNVDTLAKQLRVKSRFLQRKLKEMGVEGPEDWRDTESWYLDQDTISLIAAEFGYDTRDVTMSEGRILEENAKEPETGNLKARAPVVTIMGHVDHGKTSILDLFRRARVVSGEAGGITQHIGAYQVNVDEVVDNLKFSKLTKAEQKKLKKKVEAKGAKKELDQSRMITFLDTPGHAAFSAMRSRGAKVTDIVVLVVAASEGVMPQTKEAIDHAKAAGVPLIVAVNKIDLPEANVEKIQQQLSEHEVVSEDWGGENIFVPCSAHTGEGMDKLIEAIQLQAELLELKAPYEGAVEGSIVEAHLDKGRGPVATALIQKGTFKVGDFIVAGQSIGKVRALVSDRGENLKLATPAMPVEILGLDGVPNAGDNINVVANERAARELIDLRKTKEAEEKQQLKSKMTLEDLFAKMNEGEILELPLVLKADVRGSAEAIEGSLGNLPTDKVRLKIIRTGIGGISESDILLASASNAIVIGFNVRPDSKSKVEAERLGVQIKTYEVIYHLVDEVKLAMEGLLSPDIKESELGKAEVRDVFNLSKSGVVAGSFVTEGKFVRGALARLIRDGRVVYNGKLSGLRRFKDDVKEVAKGYECGISLENYNDIKQGDIIEAYQQEQIAATLESAASKKTDDQQQPNA